MSRPEKPSEIKKSAISGNENLLSKEQQTFITRTEKIIKLQRELSELSEKLELARTEYINIITPYIKDYLQLRISKIKILDECWFNVKLSKTNKNILSELICEECKEILSSERNEDIIQILERHEDKSLEEIEEEDQKIEEEFKNIFEQAFNSDMNTAEEPAKKKSKKQIQKEITEQKKAELKKKSVKDIYIGLIKKFHPDKELDENKKSEKEEAAKILTEAYKKNDLFTLLQYEIQLTDNNTNRVKELAEEKLEIYNELLNEKRIQLESELHILKINNEEIYRGMCTNLSDGKRYLKKLSGQWKQQNAEIKAEINRLRSKPSHVKQLIEIFEENQENLFFDFYDL